jgi:glycosyltransferase involved in cell wall biosynthesis
MSNDPTRIVVLSEIPTPYRAPLYRRLAERPDIELDVLFCSREQPDRPWALDGALEGVRHTYLPGFGVRFGGRRNTFVYEVNATVVREIRRLRPDVLVIGGYAVFAEQAAIAYAQATGTPYLLHSESTNLTERATWKRAVKHAVVGRIVGNAAAGLAVGSNAAAYLASYGLETSRIRIFPNTVDVHAYARAADTARADGPALRKRRSLPERYWFFAGRLVEDKGLTDLVEAVRILDGEAPPLYVAGTGPLAGDLEHEPGVEILGFQQQAELIELMALAEATIVPSRFEPWGVVVNEALAAGSPLIVTDQVGAAADLVVDGENGRIVPARDPVALAEALRLPPPGGGRDVGRIMQWDYDFAVDQFVEAVAIARSRG